MPDIRTFYVSVLSQTLSPCEKYLAAGTNFGNINIFDIDSIYSSNETTNVQDHEDIEPPVLLKNFSVGSKPLQAMMTVNTSLVVGAQNCLQGYSWDSLIAKNSHMGLTKPDWKIGLNLPKDFGTKESVDCIALRDEKTAYVACGDSNIYQVDFEHGTSQLAFSGHSDIIHSISLSGNLLATASEDGNVFIWDLRKPKPVHTIIPHSESKLKRPLGKWVGAVSMNDDWMVCGGGPHLGLYHLRSLTLSKVLLEDEPNGINYVNFYDDSIVVGIDGPFVYHCLFSGDVTVKMPTTPLRVYSVCIKQSGEPKLMTVGGASSEIDICIGTKLQDRIIRCPS